MNGVEGAGGANILQRLLSETVRPLSSSEGREAARQADREVELTEEEMWEEKRAAREDATSEALRDSGFVDIHGGAVANLRTYVAHASDEPEEVVENMDSQMAWELASHLGAELTGDVNLALRILAQVDPKWVAILLK